MNLVARVATGTGSVLLVKGQASRIDNDADLILIKDGSHSALNTDIFLEFPAVRVSGRGSTLYTLVIRREIVPGEAINADLSLGTKGFAVGTLLNAGSRAIEVVSEGAFEAESSERIDCVAVSHSRG